MVPDVWTEGNQWWEWGREAVDYSICSDEESVAMGEHRGNEWWKWSIRDYSTEMRATHNRLEFRNARLDTIILGDFD